MIYLVFIQDDGAVESFHKLEHVQERVEYLVSPQGGYKPEQLVLISGKRYELITRTAVNIQLSEGP